MGSQLFKIGVVFPSFEMEPEDIGLENIIFIGKRPGVGTIESEERTPEQAAEDVAVWKEAGANAVCFETLFLGCQSAAAHIGILRRIARGFEL
jgi:hypothetical protein